MISEIPGQNDFFADLIERLDEQLPKELLFVEVGTAGGQTALRAIDALGKRHSKRWYFTIDPYGDKPYVIGNQTNLLTYGYNDDAYRSTMELLKKRANEREVNHTHWHMRSQDFMKVFEQIQFWSGGDKIKPEYGFAFLDGEHAWNPVGEELRWFYHRMPAGGVIVIDDYNLLGGDEEFIKGEFAGLSGEWYFNTTDNHFRAYFTKK